MKGRSRQKGEYNLAKGYRIKEVARLLAFGFSVDELSHRFGVTKVTIGNYIKEAESLGYVAAFSEKRDGAVETIVGRNLDILSRVTDMLSNRVDEWKELKGDDRPSISNLLAVAAHTAKVSGTIKDERTPEVNIQNVQQNIMVLQQAEDELMERLGLSKKKLDKEIKDIIAD